MSELIFIEDGRSQSVLGSRNKPIKFSKHVQQYSISVHKQIQDLYVGMMMGASLRGAEHANPKIIKKLV